MSTRTRESAPPGKEKRGTSPSPAGSAQCRRNAIPSKTTSKAETTDSAPPGRSIPSYLKPTASSTINDVSKQHSKKPAVPTSTDTANLARRRSLDNKPPSASPVSLGHTLRSSSFSGKNLSDSSNKPDLARRRSLDNKALSPSGSTGSASKPDIARRRSLDNKPPSPSRTQKSPVTLNHTLRSTSFLVKSCSDSANKPDLARRRSFDKPPSPSRTHKLSVSPNPALRSSSFSGKIGASQKGTLERNLKGAKEVGKQHTLYTRPVSTVKKNSVLAKKNEPVSGSSRKGRVATSPGEVENPSVHNVLEPEPEPDDQEHFLSEEEKVPVEDFIDNESVDSLLDDQGVPNIIEQTEGRSEDKDPEVVRIESPMILEQHDVNIVIDESLTPTENQDDKVASVDASTILEHHDAYTGVDTQEVEEKLPLVEEISSSQQEEVKEDDANEVIHSDTDESAAGNINQEVEEKETEEDSKEEAAAEVEEISKEEVEVDRPGSGELKEKGVQEVVMDRPGSGELKEKEVQEVVVKETDEATPRVAHRKKDVALSNDVIEETTNKLIEQRRNKVKALAGAFESVISLQDPK